MNPQWRDHLVSRGARFAADAAPDAATVLDFGQPEAELQQAASGTVLVPLGHLGLIGCGGDEAKAFLHNQLTSDINHLETGQIQHSAWCSAKGRMLANFLIFRQGEDYRLQLAAELVEPIRKRLQMFVLRAKVTLADLSGERVALGLAGPQAEAALAAAGLPLPANALSSAEDQGRIVLRLEDGRWQVIVPASEAATVWDALVSQARPAGLDAWTWCSVRAGIPLITGITREEFVPQMADFEKLGGVSFHKGCYPGQEVVARTQYLGKVKRHLFRVQSAQPLQAGDALHSPDYQEQACGQIVNAAPDPAGGFTALAVIQSNYAGNAHHLAANGPLLATSPVNP